MLRSIEHTKDNQYDVRVSFAGYVPCHAIKNRFHFASLIQDGRALQTTLLTTDSQYNSNNTRLDVKNNTSFKLPIIYCVCIRMKSTV